MQALALYQRVLGSEHLDVASSLNNLAALYYALGDYNRAKPLLLEALALYQRLLPEHPNVAAISNNLAQLYQLQGN